MAYNEQDFVDGWQIYSDWLDALRNDHDEIKKLVEEPEFKQSLSKCKTNFERFKLIWENQSIMEWVREVQWSDCNEIERDYFKMTKKFPEESQRWREQGNKSFKNNKFEKALKEYTEAVRLAPYPNTPWEGYCLPEGEKDNSLALALANRSAALYSLTRYRQCILDIDLALKYGYPEANKFKLLIRKVKCLHVLSVWANDVEQIKDNLKAMMKRSDTKEFVKVEIQNMFKFLEQTQPEDMTKDELDVVDETTMKISNASKTLSQAADCVEMSYECDKGRYLMTNKDVSFGRLLLAEEPYVCNLDPRKRDLYCYNCYGKLYSCGLGCINCSQVLYCSEDCLNTNMKIHTLECNRFLDLQLRIGVAYIVAHIMFKINFDLTSIPIYTKKTVEKSLDDVLNISPSDWPDMVYKNEYSSVLSLMDHSSEHDYDAVLGYTLTAAYLLAAIMEVYEVELKDSKLGTDKQFQLVFGSVILKHLMQLQTNLISILDQNLQGMVSKGHTLSELEEQPIGVGIYPTISLLNHSCSPNILSIFHRNKFVARAAKALECGTEVNYCYGPSVGRMSKKDRLKRLKDQYFFDCTCDSCANNKENESRALLCPNCRGPVIYNLDMTNKCLKCNGENILDVENHLQKIRELKQLLEQQSAQVAFAQKLQTILEIEVKLAKLVYWLNPMFVQIKTELIECAEKLGDTSLALKYCEDELELCSKTFGKESYESIMTKLKFINIKWEDLYYTIKDGETEEDRNKAIEELKSLLTTVMETRGKLKDLLASTNILGAESSYDAELKFLFGIHTSINKYLQSLEPPKEPAEVEKKPETFNEIDAK